MTRYVVLNLSQWGNTMSHDKTTNHNPSIVSDDSIAPINSDELVITSDDVSTDDTPSTDDKPSTPVHVFNIVNHDPLMMKTLVNAKLTNALAFRTLKHIIDDDSHTLTLSNDVELSYNTDDKTYTLALIDNKSSACKRDLVPLDVSYDIDINIARVQPHSLTRGKCYLRTLSLTANVLRAIRPLTNDRTFTIAIESTRNDVDLVIPYTSSLQSIALTVCNHLTSCDTTALFIFNALMTAFNQPTLDLSCLDVDVKLPTIKRLKTSYTIAKS